MGPYNIDLIYSKKNQILLIDTLMENGILKGIDLKTNKMIQFEIGINDLTKLNLLYEN